MVVEFVVFVLIKKLCGERIWFLHKKTPPLFRKNCANIECRGNNIVRITPTGVIYVANYSYPKSAKCLFVTSVLFQLRD